jgi:type I restriction enzyme M protein
MSITQAELENYLWGAATILRGTIDAGDYKQFIFPLLFYKRISDVWDEEYQHALVESKGDLDYASFAENHRFQIPEGAHWEDTRAVTANVGQALQSAMRAIEQTNPRKLYGVFGDAQWTNKERLSDETLRDLIEHFSQQTLSTENAPEDQFGQAYEYLIRRFADDSGHTAQEFYTNRTLVYLMTLILDPQPGESVYDPTCGTGGMLLSAVSELKRQGREYRNLNLYGQELNLMSSSIARMNLFFHGIMDFEVSRGNTLLEPRFLDGDRLQQFDVVLANPPYSIKQWDRGLWAADPYGRNRFGTPPQGRADYAFIQHILASMKPDTGRGAVLLSHGILFRQEEEKMRERMIEADVIECVLGLGPGLFYNSPMESCVLFCRQSKPAERKGKVLFIDAANEFVRGRASSHLGPDNITAILSAYRSMGKDSSVPARLVDIDEIARRGYSLSIPLYLGHNGLQGASSSEATLPDAISTWHSSAMSLRGREGQSLRVDPAEYWLGKEPEWLTLNFAEVAENATDVAREPEAEGLELYVGLNHLDSESLRIRRFGHISDGTTFTRRFRKGQVLFGKRRAYQRKAAVAHFDGVCSGDILVLSPCGNELRPDLLPFLVQSDGFFDHAIRTSAGALSPRTKWSALAEFTFKAPSEQVQGRVSKLLNGVERARARMEDAAEKAWLLVDATRAEFFSSQEWGGEPLEALARKGPQNGVSVPKSDREGPVGMVNMGELFGGEVVSLEDLETVRLTDRAMRSHLLEEGDLLFARRSIVTDGAGLCSLVPAKDGPATFESSIIRVSPDANRVLPRFLLHYFRSQPGRRQMRSIARLGAVAGIAGSDLRRLQVPLPSMAEQEAIVQDIDKIQERARFIAAEAQALLSLRRALLRVIFVPLGEEHDVH